LTDGKLPVFQMSVTIEDLRAADWPEDAVLLEQALARAAELAERGIKDPAYVLKLLRREFAADFPAGLTLRPVAEAAPLLAEAIEAVTPKELRNLDLARRQILGMLRSPVVERGALLPDASPVGEDKAALPVGGVVAARGAIIPAAHGSDICCSMFATVFESAAAPGAILDTLMKVTRFGPGGRPLGERVYHPVLEEDVWENPFLARMEEIAAEHLADQGDGNHFAYLGRLRCAPADLERLQPGVLPPDTPLARGPEARDYLVLVTHHGSRGLGANVYARGLKAARKHVQALGAEEEIPDSLAWLDPATEVGREYWDALQYVRRWTRANHECIHAGLLRELGARPLARFGNEHNFIWRNAATGLYLHAKGSTPAWRDPETGRPVLGLVPLNMAAPILLVAGGDNAQFLSFCPHGAGRNLSRRASLREFYGKGGTMKPEVVAERLAGLTKGIDARWYNGRADISETPFGYKPAEKVREQIEKFQLGTILAEIHPLGCIMAGARPPRREEDELTPKQRRQIAHRAERRKVRQDLHVGGDWEE
jgi:RNA-splicing ligase RtcB